MEQRRNTQKKCKRKGRKLTKLSIWIGKTRHFSKTALSGNGRIDDCQAPWVEDRNDTPSNKIDQALQKQRPARKAWHMAPMQLA